MQPRLTASLRVAALLRRADLEGRGAYVVHRGDDTAGAICLTVVRPGGRAELWGQDYDPMADARAWVMQLEGTPSEIDAAVRRRAADPDLWAIELELPEGAPVTELVD